MAAVAAVIGGLKTGIYSGLSYGYQEKRHFCKEDFYGDASIQIEGTTLRPNRELVGAVEVVNETDREVLCKEIFIQLEATIEIEFEDTNEGTTERSRKCIFFQQTPPPQQTIPSMEGVWETNTFPEDDFLLSPVTQTLLKNEPLIGSKTCPFRLHLPSQPLPAPFRTPFGILKYKVCVYLRKSCCNFLLRETKPLQFSGYNILAPFIFEEPIKYESGLSISSFSFRQPLTAEMTLKRKGFLPGENASFILKIKNSKQFLVNNINACLVQKSIYTANGKKKSSLKELHTFHNEEANNDGELICKGKLIIPQNCAPTYTSSLYTLIHLIMYKIHIEENALPLKGEIEIVVGTERRDDPVGLKPQPRKERSSSVASLASNVSELSIRTANTITSFPPNYSELSSRAESLQSLETLPPNYEDTH